MAYKAYDGNNMADTPSSNIATENPPTKWEIGKLTINVDEE